MDMHCSTASSSLSRTNVEGGLESFLPDEIITNILSRLQVKDVLRCRCVVKRWRDLTSTQHFVDLHKEQGMAHMILVDTGKRKNRRDQFFLDKWWIPARKKPIIYRMHSYPLYHTEFSRDGLLVMRSRCLHEILIVNPTNREKVRISISPAHAWTCEVYGIYFNPNLKEYCILLRVTLKLGVCPLPIAYKILNLGPEPRLIDIRNPYKDRIQFSNFGWKHSILVDEFLYWMVDPLKQDEQWVHVDIIEFDIRSEEFKLMRYPAQRTAAYGSLGINLFNVDGVLTLFQFSRGEGHVDVNIWTLKDRASESWTSSHYCVSLEVYPWEFKAIGVKSGELVLVSNRTLFVYNLKQGTTRIFGKKKYSYNSFFISHGLCLSSLKNCKPMIRIGNGNRMKCQDCDSLDKEDTSSSNSDEGKNLEFYSRDKRAGSST